MQIKEPLAKPEFIILDITHRCNLKCNICEIRKDPGIKEFTTEEVKDLISQSIAWGVKEFVLSGGEPLAREDIFEILGFVKENNYHVGVLSNGVLLQKEFLKKLTPYLISNTLSLSISIDALTPEIHDDIRGAEGCFNKTLDGLKLLSELKKQHPNINFNTISIILNENLEELFNLASLLKSLDVNSIQFQPLLANNLIMRERKDRVKYWIYASRLPTLDKAIDTLVEFKKQNYQLVRNSENNLTLVKKYFRGLLTNEDVKCLYGTKTMLIANTGDVTTCFGCYGNVRKTPLIEVFNSHYAEQARQEVSLCKKPCLLPCFTDN
jgi:AdoMet-dependent heme synthase